MKVTMIISYKLLNYNAIARGSLTLHLFDFLVKIIYEVRRHKHLFGLLSLFQGLYWSLIKKKGADKSFNVFNGYHISHFHPSKTKDINRSICGM